MRRSLFALLSLALVSGCVGPTGPELPPNVGATHDPSVRGSGSERPAPEPQARAVEVGTPVWASFRDTGFFFFGYVVERRDAQHRVIYADGASEWVPARSLLPDALGADARVHVRGDYDGDFAEADVVRRVGQALYVRFANGDEGWTALPHVRFQAGAEGVPRRGDAPREPARAAAPDPVGSSVLVNYRRQGLGFAGVITAERDDGRLHVVYLDGETEWVGPSLVRAEAVAEGDTVHIRRRWDPPQWVRGHVRRRVGHAFHVELDDGGVAWTSLFRLRVPLPEGGEAPEADPAEAGEGPAAEPAEAEPAPE
jgi:hypothetical protein